MDIKIAVKTNTVHLQNLTLCIVVTSFTSEILIFISGSSSNIEHFTNEPCHHNNLQEVVKMMMLMLHLKHLFIDEILNVWQHIQNGEHKEDEDNSNALHTLPQFHSSFMGQIKNWYQKPCHNPSQDGSFAVHFTSSQVFHTSTNKSFAFY